MSGGRRLAFDEAEFGAQVLTKQERVPADTCDVTDWAEIIDSTLQPSAELPLLTRRQPRWQTRLYSTHCPEILLGASVHDAEGDVMLNSCSVPGSARTMHIAR